MKVLSHQDFGAGPLPSGPWSSLDIDIVSLDNISLGCMLEGLWSVRPRHVRLLVTRRFKLQVIPITLHSG